MPQQYILVGLSKLRKYKVKIIISIIFVIAIFAVYKLFFISTYIQNGVKYFRNWKGEVTQAEVINKIPEPTNQAEIAKQVNSWEIIDNSQSPPYPTGLYYYNSHSYIPDVLKWNDYLIGFTKDYFIAKSTGAYLGAAGPVYNLQSTIRHIRILNTKTNETYSISLQKPTWGEIDTVYPQLIDNNYFLKVGSYGPRSSGFEYRLKLPPTRNSSIDKLQYPIGNILYKFDNFYLTSSCYEGCYYQKVNINTLKATELKRLNEAANEHYLDRIEKLMGFTDKGEMVLDSENGLIAVSWIDENSARKMSDLEVYNDINKVVPDLSPQEYFELLNLETNYTLEQRTAEYPITSK